MKTLVYVLILAVLWQSCNHTASRTDTDDSLQYYPPTPAILDKQEFRYYFRRLSGFFDTTLLNGNFNGGILIARDGAVIYEKYKGFADLRTKDSLTDSTSLHIASTSKPFTATAILRLVDQKKLSLDDTLGKFFPGFPYGGITVKMLLNHRSGIPNYLYFLKPDYLEKISKEKGSKYYVSNNDVINYLINEKPNKSYSANTRFNYCNTNYVLLASIVEKISGQTFPDFMQEQFFKPLQMNHTYVFQLKDTLTSIPSFTGTGTYWEYDHFDATYGDKNIYTTPRDLLKWDQALYTDQIISPALKDSAFAAYSFERPGINNYGLGWRLRMIPNGKKVIYHFGKWHGFNAAFARLTDEKATIIILGNRFTRMIYNSAHLCYDIFGDYKQGKGEDDDDGENLSTDKKQAKKRSINNKAAGARNAVAKSK